MIEEKDEYIKFLENKIKELSHDSMDINEKDKYNFMLKYQEEFFSQMMLERSHYLYLQKKLTEENSNLIRALVLNNNYTLSIRNSKWWKLTYPLRKLYNRFRMRNYNFFQIPDTTNIKKEQYINEKISFIIIANNVDNNIIPQIENIINQKYVNDIEIIIIDRGNNINSQKIISKYNINYIKIEDTTLNDFDTYIKFIPKVNGNIIVLMDQNKVINGNDWLYKSVEPIIDGNTIITAFFKEDIFHVRNGMECNELKNRITELYNEQVFFYPSDNKIIHYMDNSLFDKTSVIVYKK